MPGVTYEKRLQFTRFGPMRLHILTAPKPDGSLYRLQPVLSNGSVLGRERVTTMQRRADCELDCRRRQRRSLHLGRRHSEQRADPGRRAEDDSASASRSMIGVDVVGNLRVEKIAMLGTWQGSGPRRPVHLVNRRAGAERDDPLHPGLRPDHAGDERRDRGRAVAVPGRDAEHGPGRLRHGDEARRDADPAGRRCAGGERHRRASGSRSRPAAASWSPSRLVLAARMARRP